MIEYGTELHLPESKVLKWEDIKYQRGFYSNCLGEISNTKGEDIGQNVKHIFATEQQAKSAQAAAMISQIREMGKETYGDIVKIGEEAYIIRMDSWISCGRVEISGHMYFFGGLLRFFTKEQAELFLENNRELVLEYLTTF